MSSDLQQQLQSTLGSGITLERELGGGGMSRVFVAHETELNRPIVVKVLPPEMAASVAVERFRREIQLSAQLQHPCIVPLLTTGTAFGCPYYTMPFVEGETLKQKLEKSGALPIAECLKILRDIASALAYAHARGIVHRDLKPANVLISGGYALVMDFGIAKALSDSVANTDDSITSKGMALGTPTYMAPEQITGDPDLDHRADLYAWGVVAYETLTGRPPFTAQTPQRILAAHMIEVPEPIARRRNDIPASVASIVMRCLEKDALSRPQRADEVVATLDFSSSLSGESLALEPSEYRPSIAVLPFSNMSADPENEYFSDGMTDEIINALTHMRMMRVASRMSSFSFKGKSPDIKSVAGQLNVTSVLAGSVRKSGSRLRITAQLIDVATESPIWSEHYDRQTADVFDIQDEIASAIAGALELTLLGEDLAKKRPTENLAAYELYLKGRFYWNQRGEGIKKGLEFFQSALKLDPDYALALVGIADCYITFGFYDFMPPRDAYTKAKAAALKALALDDSLAEAHTSRAIISFFYDWDFKTARSEFERALELNPTYTQAHMWFGALHVGFRRFSEGIAEAKRTIEIDPLSPLAGVMLGWFLFMARRHDEAIEQLEKTVELDPNRFLTHLLLGLAYSSAGDEAKAISSLERSVALSNRAPWPLGSLGYVFGHFGHGARAHAIFDELQSRSEKGYVPHSRIATALAGIGPMELILDHLEAAARDRESWTTILLIDPVMDEIRSHPRFVRLLEQSGMI